MKIKNEIHYAILGTDFTVDAMGQPKTYKKGHKAKTYGMLESGGEYIVEGHGTGHIIPRQLFTKFKHAWDEVETTVENGAKVIKTVHKNVDETEKILKWWADCDAATKAEELNDKRRVLRKHIAHYKNIIKEVKTGKAEAELAKLLKELETLKT
jgi:hypothetical protein